MFPPLLTDSLLSVSQALPNGATNVSAVVDMGNTANADWHNDGEFLVSMPALTTAQLPDTQTMTYDIYESPNADGSSAVLVTKQAGLQTGAGGAGAAAATFRYKPRSTAARSLVVKATNSGSGNASTVSFTVAFVI